MLADMTVLVTGAAGYIGSHMLAYLQRAKINTVSLDNLSSGQLSMIRHGTFYQVDIADIDQVDRICKRHHVQAVFHFAAMSSVDDSFRERHLYWYNNVEKSILFINTLLKNKVPYFIFSSSAAVYGHQENQPIQETASICPINPYGETKRTIERFLQQLANERRLHSICLRYFNAAGAMPELGLGECRRKETHIIPLAIQHAIEQTDFKLFGHDYPTRDGTCIRDYIHVRDICNAHLLALVSLIASKQSDCFNIGVGKGYSNLDIIHEIERQLGCALSIRYKGRRLGDPPQLVADCRKIQTTLGWAAAYPSITKMIQDAVAWYRFKKQGHLP